MRLITSLSWITAMLSSSLLVAATETQTYLERGEERSITMQTTAFSPSHPQCNKPKTPITFVTPAPIAAVVPAAAPTPKAKPAPVAVIAKTEGDQDKDGVVDSMDKCPDTPRGYKVDPTGCPVSVDLRLHFAFNSSILPVSDYPQVDKLAKIMKDNPPAKAIIVGHTDASGTDEYNQKLSERRSKALGDRLVKDGIAADRITTSGKGEKEPMATNNTREGRALNRRIHVELK